MEELARGDKFFFALLYVKKIFACLNIQQEQLLLALLWMCLSKIMNCIGDYQAKAKDSITGPQPNFNKIKKKQPARSKVTLARSKNMRPVYNEW